AESTPPRTRRKVWWILGLVASVVAAIGLAFAASSELESEPTVRAARVVRGSIALRIPAIAPGRVTAARELTLRSEVAARVVKVLARSGATVSEGAALLELDAEELESAVRSAEIATKIARASAAEATLRAAFARKTAKRLRSLSRTGSVTVADAERHEHEAQVLTQTQIAAALHLEEQVERLESVKRAARRGVIRAPIDGLVTSISVVEGAAVTPGHALAVVSDASELYVSAQIDESDASRLEVAMPVELRFEGEEKPPLRSFIARIDPSVSDSPQGSRIVGIEVALPSDLRKRLGLSVEVDVLAAEREKALLVPVSALLKERREVFVLQNGRAAPRRVETGIVGFTHAEIVRGLNEGDLIVDNPALAGLSGASEIRWEEAPPDAGRTPR
ncbi:MAG TPA: efflux RND transporter periplasmic adaptor subunit, partial [Polyangiaceae bacterium]